MGRGGGGPDLARGRWQGARSEKREVVGRFSNRRRQRADLARRAKGGEGGGDRQPDLAREGGMELIR